MTLTRDNNLLAVFAQPSEPLALALALLFNRYGWDTEGINRQPDGQYVVCMVKSCL